MSITLISSLYFILRIVIYDPYRLSKFIIMGDELQGAAG